jgi:hypothetical protein
MLSRKISGGLSGLALVNPSPSRSSSRRHGMLFCETFYHEHSNGARLAGLLTSLGLFLQWKLDYKAAEFLALLATSKS